ncbi:unnamed protein product [Bursaphelenchus xylophilus]|uniref:(pine wood nematode) hypothetical protein n=1 Tax=Bursaphelenchus xylophilus TaxID=6326 RepID=A0A7I8X086_BURXY|nr:unnamed protein product [Bursaphelenchus xylophilus]CAG9129868.1 unnamed protein product [Bursaphelenchus xylophilus]
MNTNIEVAPSGIGYLKFQTGFLGGLVASALFSPHHYAYIKNHVLTFLLVTTVITQSFQYADPFTAGTILDSWGGNLGPSHPNSIQSASYRPSYGYGFFG